MAEESALVPVYSAMLAEPARTPEEKAAALIGRAHSLERLWRPGDAAADVDAAIALSPRSALLHLERAQLLGMLGRPAEAAAPLQTAFLRDPDSSRTAAVLGVLRFQEGRLAEAAEALGFHVESGASEPSMRLLRATALLRTGRRADVSRLGTFRDPWPGALGSFLARRIEREALLALARAEQEASVQEVACRTRFYLGQRALMEGKPDRAARDFVGALRTGCTTAIEYRLAVAELIRLGVLTADSLPGSVG